MTKISIDCGANQGDVVEKLLKETDVVYAFEPAKIPFKKLKKRFQNNPKVKCFNNLILDKKSKLKLNYYMDKYGNEGGFQSSSIFSRQGRRLMDQPFDEVESIDLCEFIKSLGENIHILKMDIEGAEYRVLNKLIDTKVIFNIDKLFVEFHANKIKTLKDEEVALEKKIKSLGIDNIYGEWAGNGKSLALPWKQ